MINFPSEQEKARYIHQEVSNSLLVITLWVPLIVDDRGCLCLQVSTPRRARPSHRFSLLPRDLLQSPYARQDALDAQHQLISSPSKSTRLPPSPMPASRLAVVADPEESSSSEEDELHVEQESVPVEQEMEVDDSEEESEQESELDEHEEKENVPLPATAKTATPARVRSSHTPMTALSPDTRLMGSPLLPLSLLLQSFADT